MTSERDESPNAAPLVLLTQGHAGDRLGARLAQALRARFPGREILGAGGPRMSAQGVRVVARTDAISAMGWTGVAPQVPRIFLAMMRLKAAVRPGRPLGLPACVIAVDIWQPLQVMHRFVPELRTVPHLCYLPPGPNFTGLSRVHGRVAKIFESIVTPFPHQARLYAEAGGHVRMAAHAGLETCREEATPLPEDAREPVLALLPGSRSLEVGYGLGPQFEAAREILARHPELTPVVCCANDEIARYVARRLPGVATAPNARQVLARARFAIICSGTAALEAALLGCPGVVTYHGSRLQKWEWERFHVEAIARLRAAGVASPYVSLPNILLDRELYPELLGAPGHQIAGAGIRMLAEPASERAGLLRQVGEMLSWADAGSVVAEETARLVSTGGSKVSSAGVAG